MDRLARAASSELGLATLRLDEVKMGGHSLKCLRITAKEERELRKKLHSK